MGDAKGPHGGPPVPTVPPPFRGIGDKRGPGILREPRSAEAVLNMCAHGADHGCYCGYCGGYSQGGGLSEGLPSNVGLRASVTNTPTPAVGDELVEQWLSDRERLEASAPPAMLRLADSFSQKLTELGHHDFANRRALLLTLAQMASAE